MKSFLVFLFFIFSVQSLSNVRAEVLDFEHPIKTFPILLQERGYEYSFAEERERQAEIFLTENFWISFFYEKDAWEERVFPIFLRDRKFL